MQNEKCDLCGAPAEYDARIPAMKTWGYLCHKCFVKHECSLGVGGGQRLKKEDKADV